MRKLSIQNMKELLLWSEVFIKVRITDRSFKYNGLAEVVVKSDELIKLLLLEVNENVRNYFDCETDEQEFIINVWFEDKNLNKFVKIFYIKQLTKYEYIHA